MKINWKNIAIGILLLGFYACTDDMDRSKNGQGQDVRVFANVMHSRVSFEQEGNVTHAFWDDGDKIGIYAGEYKNLCYQASASGTSTTEFKPVSEALRVTDGTSVIAYHPYTDSPEGMDVALPNTRNYVWTEMRPFVYANCSVSEGSASLQFKHIYAYLKVSIGNDDVTEWAGSSILNTVEISADGLDLGASEGYFNLETKKQVLSKASSTITVDANDFDLSKEDFCCYIPVLPQDGGKKLNVKFIQQDGHNTEYLFSCQKTTSEKGILAGYVYEVTLDDEELQMSQVEQKEKIDAVGREFLSYLEASDFKEMKNTFRYIGNTFCKYSDQTNEVANWWEACVNAITQKQTLGNDTVREEYHNEYYYDDRSYIYNYYYHYSDITRIYAASQFVGHFKVENNQWVKEAGQADDLQFTCQDENGQICTVKLTATGATKKVYVGDSRNEDWYNFKWDETSIDSIRYEVWEVDSLSREEWARQYYEYQFFDDLYYNDDVYNKYYDKWIYEWSESFETWYADSSEEWFIADLGDWYERLYNSYCSEYGVENVEKTDQWMIVRQGDWYNYTHYKYEYFEDIDVNDYHHYVQIPEKIKIEYLRGNQEIMRVEINTDHSKVTSENFDVATNDLSITAEAYINGYEFITSKAAYSAKKNVETSFKMNKHGQNLISLSAYSDMNVSGDLYEGTAELNDMKNATVEIDILHQMQLKMTSEDCLKFNEYLDAAEDNRLDETQFKNQLTEANKWINGGLYFDGQKTRQSWVTLEPFQTEDWFWDDVNGYYEQNCWTWEPVINFNDGSSYSTFSAFFNEDDFHTLINLAWDVCDDFANLVRQLVRDWDWD